MKNLLKTLGLIIRICIVGSLAFLIVQQRGQVAITLEQNGVPVAYDIALPVVLSALVILLLLFLALARLFDDAARLPQHLALRVERRRLQEGYFALTQSLVAIAAGDGQGAEKLAQQAAKKLDQPPLSLLLRAQAAQLKGDTGAASRFFHQLSADPKAGFLGLRGQLIQEMKSALSSGYTDHARRLAAEAEQKEPRSPWVMQARFALEARAKNWREAEQVLARGARFQAFSKEEARFNLAALLYLQSLDATTRDDARRFARRAFETFPALVPAAVHYADMLVAAGRRNSAADVISKAWSSAPHPDLAAAWQKLFNEKSTDSSDNFLARVRWLDKLLLLNDTDGEALLARAGALLDARLWGDARAVLMKLKNAAPDARTYGLLARLEMDEKGDTAAADAWLRTGESLVSPAWVCRQDGTRNASWHALCPTCGSFATARWSAVQGNLPMVFAA